VKSALTSRRAILIGIAALSAAGGRALFRHFESRRRTERAREIISRLAFTYDLTPFGRASVDRLALPPDFSVFVSILERHLGESFSTLNSDTAMQAIQAAMEDDFDKGDLVEVQGWLVPRTTALLAAASATMPQTRRIQRSRDI
jgi:hypothetical protein